MASYPNSLARVTAPRMQTSKGQPRPVIGQQRGMVNAASRRLQKTRMPKKSIGY